MLCTSVVGQAQDQPAAAATPSQAPAFPSRATSGASRDPDAIWHASAFFYLWFPGAHGTLGTPDRNADFRASPGDLLSHFRFGLMGGVQARRGRFVLISDLVWTRLRAANATTLPILGTQLSAEAKADQLFITPEGGYRFIDAEKLKADWLLGFRYWYLQSSLQLTSPRFGLNLSRSSSWAAPVMGFRFQFPLARKLALTILGDAGGAGIGSELEYQVLGLVGYKVSTNVTLGGGYRYLYVNYRPGDFIYETAMSGAMVGLNYNIK
ncbi:MAG: hypothetical protein ACJ746_23260 [Bryobacteraceae bacterium]